jgi:hypothetical protein
MFNDDNIVRRVVGGLLDPLVRIGGAAAAFVLPPDPTIIFSSVLAFVRSIEQNEIASKTTSTCLVGEHWGYRDSDIDRKLPTKQLLQAAGSIGVYRLQVVNGVTPREMAIAVLGVAPDMPDDQLAETLRKKGHMLTLPALEDLVERREGREDGCLAEMGEYDEHSYLAFVEDNGGGVALIFLHRIAMRWATTWQSRIGAFDDSDRWFSGNYLLVRNPDVSAG